MTALTLRGATSVNRWQANMATFVPMVVMVFGFTLAALAISTATDSPTKGSIPPDAFLTTGEIDRQLVPDFVAVIGPDAKIAGYSPRDVVLGGLGNEQWPVFADDLTTLVGHMVPDKGFVPLGTDERSIPRIPAVVGSE